MYFWSGFTRSGSQPGISWSVSSTTEILLPSAEYMAATSRPMMPPPIDQQALWDVGQLERAGRVDDALVVGQPGQRRGARAGGDHAVVELDLRPVDVHRAVGCEPGRAAHDVHLALLGEPVEAARQLADHLVLPAAERVEVDLGLAEPDAEVARLSGLGDHASRVQDRLRRDAADVQADPAERLVALDERHVEAEVGGAERGRVATDAGADHEDALAGRSLRLGGRRRRLGLGLRVGLGRRLRFSRVAGPRPRRPRRRSRRVDAVS